MSQTDTTADVPKETTAPVAAPAPAPAEPAPAVAAAEPAAEETPAKAAEEAKPVAEEEKAADAPKEEAVAEEEEEEAKEDESARIEELKALIAARQEAIAAAKAVVEGFDAEAKEQELWAVKARHQSATREATDLEKKRGEAEPEMEKLRENEDMRVTGAKLTEDIEANEDALVAEEERAAEVEAECKATTALYAEENRRSAAFISEVQQQINALHEAFSRKIELTSAIDAEGYEAFDHLQDVSVAVMARGKQLSTLSKVLREQHCLIDINAARKESVNGDFEAQNGALLRQKDEQIRDAVFRFQDERARLHHDIEDMQRINKEQAIALKSGEVLTKADKVGTIGTKTTQSTREAEEQSRLNADVEALTEKLALAKGDISAALEGLRSATKVKSDLIKEDKTLSTRIQWDKTHQDAEIANIQQSTQVANQTRARQERENEKLAENIKLLTRQVKRLKDAADTIENRTKPLPVE